MVINCIMNINETIARTIGTLLDRFINRNQHSFPHASEELSHLTWDIALVGKIANRKSYEGGIIQFSQCCKLQMRSVIPNNIFIDRH